MVATHLGHVPGRGGTPGIWFISRAGASLVPLSTQVHGPGVQQVLHGHLWIRPQRSTQLDQGPGSGASGPGL